MSQTQPRTPYYCLHFLSSSLPLSAIPIFINSGGPKLPISAIGEISKGATTKREISLDHHRLQGDRYSVVVNIQGDPKQGGILWFENLTEFPHGVLGAIFPRFIASLHFANVQVSFRTSSVGKVTGLFGLLAQNYKLYLEILTLPIMFIGFCVPQVDYEVNICTGKLETLDRCGKVHFMSNLSMLLQWSPYSTEVELLQQM